MIRGIGVLIMSTYSQTLNVEGAPLFLIDGGTRIVAPSGPFSVSGTGDAGCSATVHKGPESWLI